VAGDPAAGLTGELLQFRRHVEARRVQIRLTASNAGLVVDAVELSARGLSASPADPKGAELRAGAALDFPVVLGASDCTVEPGAPRARVRLHDAAGGRREVTVPLDDGGLARRLHDGDCAVEDLRRQAAIDVIAVRPVTGPEGPALRLTVRLRRAGGTDKVRVTGLGSNTVYSVTAIGELPVLVVDDVTLELLLVPARCDVHALGESYRTSLIGLVIALGRAEPRPFVLTPPPAVRRQLETFAVDTCRAGQ
jgi:hypothetical protein